MNAPRVFIVQQPTGRDPHTGRIQPSVNLTPTKVWGEPVFLLSHNHNPFVDLDNTVKMVKEKLWDYQPTSNDYLVLVGNPILIGIVTALYVSFSPQLRLLQWNRNERVYYPVTTTINPQRNSVASPRVPALT